MAVTRGCGQSGVELGVHAPTPVNWCLLIALKSPASLHWWHWAYRCHYGCTWPKGTWKPVGALAAIPLSHCHIRLHHAFLIPQCSSGWGLEHLGSYVLIWEKHSTLAMLLFRGTATRHEYLSQNGPESIGGKPFLFLQHPHIYIYIFFFKAQKQCFLCPKSRVS